MKLMTVMTSFWFEAALLAVNTRNEGVLFLLSADRGGASLIGNRTTLERSSSLPHLVKHWLL